MADALMAAGDKVTLRLEGGGLVGYTIDRSDTRHMQPATCCIGKN
jgi:hypothetical protein